MTSNINPALPLDDVPASKGDLRANLLAAKQEIEALQASIASFEGGSGLDFLIPESFGAVANDNSVATAAANATAFANLASAAKTNGKSIQFHPFRTYYIGDGAVSGAQIQFSQHTDFVILGNGSKLIRGDGVTLTAGGSSDPLLAFEQCKNFAIYDLTVDGNRDNVPIVDEFGHAFELWGCEDVWLIRCLGINSQGDGFAVNRTFTKASSDITGNSKRIYLISCIGDRNNRQGISLINISTCDIIGGAYNNTGPAAPSAGIDFEPDPAGNLQTVTDVRVLGVHLEGNQGSGIKMVVRADGDVSTHGWTRRAVINGCTFVNNATNRDGGSTIPIPQMSICGEDVVVTNNIFSKQTNRSGTSPYNVVWYIPKFSYNIVIANNTIRDCPAADAVVATWHVAQDNIFSVIIRDNIIDITTGLSATGNGGQKVFYIRAPGIDILNNDIRGPGDAQAIYGASFETAANFSRCDGNKFNGIQQGANGAIRTLAGTLLSCSYNLFEMPASTVHVPIAGTTALREEGNFARNMAAARNGAKTT